MEAKKSKNLILDTITDAESSPEIQKRAAEAVKNKNDESVLAAARLTVATKKQYATQIKQEDSSVFEFHRLIKSI